MSPMKTAKQRQKDVEPTNADLLTFMRHMQASQESSMKAMAARLDSAEARLTGIEEHATSRLDILESRLEGMELAEGLDKTARMRVAALEKTMKDNVGRLEQQFKEAKASASASGSSTSAPRTRGSTSQDFEPLVKIGGFEQETPRGAIESAWTTHIRPVMEKLTDIGNIVEVKAPYMLSSQLWLRFGDLSQAHSFLATLRKQDIVFKLNNYEVKVWGTLQKPKEVRDRNKRLLRVAEVLMQHTKVGIDISKDTFKNICWRSGTIVLANRRIAKVVQEGSTYSLTWGEKWYDGDIFQESDTVIKAAAQRVMDDIEL